MSISDNYLIAKADQPLICADKVWDELLLYNIAPPRAQVLFTEFIELTEKHLDANSLLTHLSGGQKVILMALLALHSPAQRICLVNLDRYLDASRAARLDELLLRSGKEIIRREEDDPA